MIWALCCRGFRVDPRYVDLGYITVMGGTPVALPLYGIQTPISAIHFSCAQLCWNVRCKHSNYFCILLENPRPYYNIIGFPIKCFG